jgi:hypothetical protein
MMAYLWQLLLSVKHETRMVIRSWPFRIVSFLCVGVAILQMVGFVMLIYFVSADAYLGPLFVGANTTFIVLAQLTGLLSWMVLFFANDIGCRDKRVGVSDVVGSRPMSVAQHVIARYLGLMIPVSLLAAVALAAALVGNKAAGFRTAEFGQYGPFFLFFCLLGVAFTAALAAFLSTLIRKRLLASLAAFVPILVFAFWLGQVNDLFDITGFNVSGSYSDLIGYGPLGGVVIHRLAYFCWTLLLLSGAVCLYPRAEGARRGRGTVLTFAALLVASAGLASYYTLGEMGAKTERLAWRDALTEASGNRAAVVERYEMDIDILPRTGRIEASVTTLLRNRDAAGRDTFVFTLNPGLPIAGVSADGAKIAVKRHGPVVELTLGTPLEPGGSLALTWDYGGKIDPRAAWLADPRPVDNWTERNTREAEGLMGDLSGWVGRRFCFFLPESHWYPVAGATFGHAYPAKQPASFATARIQVRMPAGWTGVTQGSLMEERVEGGGTSVVFETDAPVPQFSLCAGKYEKVGTTVNGVECTFYYAPIHRENVDLFADATDEIERVIGESFEKIEDALHLGYPYKSLSLVEVPSQCQSFSDTPDGRNLLVQPGVLLLRETDFFNVYFAQTYSRAEKRTKKEGTGATEAQIKAELLRRYFEGNAFGGDLVLNLLPNYWEFQIDPSGPAFPALGAAFTAALAETALGRHEQGAGEARMRLLQPTARIDGDGDGRAEINMGVPMQAPGSKFKPDDLALPLDAITPSAQEEQFTGLMTRKTEGLLRTLAIVLGDDAWPDFVPDLLEKHRFKAITLEDLEREVAARAPEEASWIFDQFVSEPVMPGFMITHAEAYEIDSGELEREFQVVLRVANLEEGNGYVQIVIETAGPAESNTVEKELRFGSQEEKEIRMVLSEKPKSVRVVPACSRNVQDPFETLYVPEERREVPGEDSVRVVPPGEQALAVIVDDTDEGFSTVSLEEASRVRLTGAQDEDASGEYPEYNRGWGSPRRWHSETAKSAYGKYMRTRKIKRKGTGKQLALWSADLPRGGVYEVFFYAEHANRGRYSITVDTGTSSQEVELELTNAKSGWNSLGKYRFQKDVQARVTLSDDVREAWRYARVNADAVKWVHQEEAPDAEE